MNASPRWIAFIGCLACAVSLLMLDIPTYSQQAEQTTDAARRVRTLEKIVLGMEKRLTALEAGRGMQQPESEYEVVITEKPITWSEAFCRVHFEDPPNRPRGHLVTISSREENTAVFAKLTQKCAESGGRFQESDFWLGGYQKYVPDERQLGIDNADRSGDPQSNWTWVTGDPFLYDNWFPRAQPSNCYRGGRGEPPEGPANRAPEDVLHFATNCGDKWNDLPRNALLLGYVVEYENR